MPLLLCRLRRPPVITPGHDITPHAAIISPPFRLIDDMLDYDIYFFFIFSLSIFLPLYFHFHCFLIIFDDAILMMPLFFIFAR